MVMAVLAGSLLLAACSANSGSSAAASSGTMVKISGLAYDPTSLTIKAGTTVTLADQELPEFEVRFAIGLQGRADAL